MFINIVKWVAILAIVFALGGFLFVTLSPVFGGSPDKQSREKIEASDNYNGKVFENRQPASHAQKKQEMPLLTWLKSVVAPPPGKHPSHSLPTQKISRLQSDSVNFTWFGHSTVLIKTQHTTLITDPVFYRASPVWLVGAPYPMKNKPLIADLPDIDAVLISHDHYDHLDIRAIKELDKKVGHFFVPLGVRAHLLRWGIQDDKITELDWFDEASFLDTRLVFTPSRHFSGRKPGQKNDTLWGSWVIKNPELNAYFSGDGGYSPDFAMIGDKYGPFDIAFMEDGAYSIYWPDSHMLPEESVQATLDVRAVRVMPVHWGKFDLSFHNWDEPATRFVQAAEKTELEVATPLIGETFTLDNLPNRKWWTQL